MVAGFNAAPPPWTLSVSLLKEVTVTLHTADGWSCRVPISPNAKRIQLLAYLAWRRGQNTSRGRILMEVFLPGLLKEKGLSDKEFWRIRHRSKEGKQLRKELGSKFDAHKQLLRQDIRAAVMRLNAERESAPLPTNLDPFEQRGQGWDRYWGLSSLWRVVDLETVEAQALIIQEGVNGLTFKEPVPESAKAACDALLAAYPGDFLEEVIRTYPEEFRPWTTSWVCEAYRLYRDYYLKALWYAGEYEWRKGTASPDAPAWEYLERAAEFFRRYAFYACNSRRDPGVEFRGAWVPRVFMSEEAICYSLTVYWAEGRVQDFEECKRAYMRHMERISRGAWKPGKDLQKILQETTSQERADGAPPASLA
jgi:hypothetical protein